MVGMPAGPVQPYVVGGFGLVRPHVHASLNPTADRRRQRTRPATTSAAASTSFFLKNVGVRGDIRHFHTLQDVSVLHLGTLLVGQKLDFNRASVGVTFRF